MRSARLRVNPRNRRRLGDCLLRRQFVFGRVGFQLFERQRQLVDQSRRALRSLPVDLALELGDPQLLLGNQRAVFRRLRPGDRQLRGNLQGLRALDASASFSAAMSSGSVAISIHADEVNHKF